jgi:Uma2 family endonuclease
MRTNRPEYQQIETLFMTNQKGIPKHEAFVVSNYIVSGVDKQKLEERFGIRVKAILHSEATSPVPDVRRFLQ